MSFVTFLYETFRIEYIFVINILTFTVTNISEIKIYKRIYIHHMNHVYQSAGVYMIHLYDQIYWRNKLIKNALK